LTYKPISAIRQAFFKRAGDSGKPACIRVVTDPSVTSPAIAMFRRTPAWLLRPILSLVF